MSIGFGNRKGDGWGSEDQYESHSWGARHGRDEDLTDKDAVITAFQKRIQELESLLTEFVKVTSENIVDKVELDELIKRVQERIN